MNSMKTQNSKHQIKKGKKKIKYKIIQVILNNSMNCIFNDSFLTIVYNKSIPIISDNLNSFPSLEYITNNNKFRFYNLKKNDFGISAQSVYSYFMECYNKTQQNFINNGTHGDLIFINSNIKFNLLSNKTSHYIVSENKYPIKFNNLNEVKFNLRNIRDTIYNVINISTTGNISIVLNPSSLVLYKYLYGPNKGTLMERCLKVYLINGPRFKWEKYKEFNESYLIKYNIPQTIDSLIKEFSTIMYNKKKNQIPTTPNLVKNKMLQELCELVSPTNIQLNGIIADYIFDITIIDDLLTFF